MANTELVDVPELAGAVDLAPPLAPVLLRCTDATGTVEVTAADVAALLAFVEKAGPVIDLLVELLPKLAAIGEGGPAGIMGLLGSMMRGGQ